MKPISTTYKNFLACGNNPITINFDEHHLNLIVGNNGAGKSMFLDAITFALYGKSFREVNKSEMVNNDNGSECIVEFVFELKGDIYKIYRGIKPNIFQIFKNDVKIEEESAASQQQAYLQDLIGIKYDAFKQIVVLGASNYIPFMKLKPSERRKFIEDILDMQVFSKMSEITRTEYKLLMERYRANGEEVRLLENELTIRLDTLKKYVATKDKGLQTFDTQIQGLITGLQVSRKKIAEWDREALQVKVDKSKNQIRTLDKVIGDLRVSKARDVNLSNFLSENETCPTCSQDLDAEFKEGELARLTKSMSKKDAQLTKTQNMKVVAEGRDDVVMRELTAYQVLTSEISESMRSLKRFEEQKNSFAKAAGDEDIQVARGLITDINTKLRALKEVRSAYDVDIQDYTKIISFLNDDGLKSEVVKKYIPIVNEKVNDYLMKMNFTGDFMLDESFNETIKARKRNKFSYKNFSEGERKRIDLALMFTWRDITNMVNQTNKINLLVLDEIFDSSLDGNGVEDFIEIIRDLEGQNIFIISHRSDAMVEHFDSVIGFKKVDGFSERYDVK